MYVCVHCHCACFFRLLCARRSRSLPSEHGSQNGNVMKCELMIHIWLHKNLTCTRIWERGKKETAQEHSDENCIFILPLSVIEGNRPIDETENTIKYYVQHLAMDHGLSRWLYDVLSAIKPAWWIYCWFLLFFALAYGFYCTKTHSSSFRLRELLCAFEKWRRPGQQSIYLI